MNIAFIDPSRIKVGAAIRKGRTHGGGGLTEEPPVEGRLDGHKKVELRIVARNSKDVRILERVLDTIDISRACPNVVQAVGFSVMKNGSVCLVTEQYVTSLDEFMDESDNPPTAEQRAGMAIDIVQTVEQLHNRGLVLKDIKPGNVLLDSNNHAFLSASCGASPSSSPASMLAAAEAEGTQHFLPPEVFLQASDSLLAPSFASNTWGLGILLTQLASWDLQQPYGEGACIESIREQLISRKVPPSVPVFLEFPGLQYLIQQCLQLDPGSRIKISDLRQGIQGVLNRVQSKALGFTDDLEMSAPAFGASGFPCGSVPYDLHATTRPPLQEVKMITSHSLSALADACDAARLQHRAVLFDLGNLPLKGKLWGDLVVPSFCTIHSGSILMPQDSKVIVEEDACLSSLSIRGVGKKNLVNVHGARVRIIGCGVERSISAGPAPAGSAAVGVFGKGSQLYISGTSICNEEGDGLRVAGGALAVMDRECFTDSVGNGFGGSGWVVEDEGSCLVCFDSSSSFNRQSNARITHGASAFFTRCRLDGSKQGSGLEVLGGGRCAISNCSTSLNHLSNVAASDRALVELGKGCRTNGSRDEYGLFAQGHAIIFVDDSCSAEGNKKGMFRARFGGEVRGRLKRGCKQPTQHAWLRVGVGFCVAAVIAGGGGGGVMLARHRAAAQKRKASRNALFPPLPGWLMLGDRK